jgi:lipopolysaccharide transport system permease protein
MVEGKTLFATSAAVITSVRIPYTSLVLRSITRNLIVAAHGLIVVAATFLYYRTAISPVAPLAFVGLVLVCVNLYWICLLIALLSARFRDVAQIFTYLIGLMLFVTPIIWMPGQVRPGSPFLLFNPLAHMVSVVREPLLNGVVPWTALTITAGMAVVGVPVTALIFARMRRYVAYWT